MQVYGFSSGYDYQSLYAAINGERKGLEASARPDGLTKTPGAEESSDKSGNGTDRSEKTGKNTYNIKLSGKKDGEQELSADDQKRVNELQSRDREVRAHEAAHVAAGGQYVTGGPSFDYQTGPDGKRYAVGGEVGIDTSPVRGDPEATIAKMSVVKRAALAPGDPSAQDRAVAASAAQKEMTARAEASQKDVKIAGASYKGDDKGESSKKAGSKDEVSLEAEKAPSQDARRSNPYAVHLPKNSSLYSVYA